MLAPMLALAQSSQYHILAPRGEIGESASISDSDSLQHWIVRFSDAYPLKSAGISIFERDLEAAFFNAYGLGKQVPSSVRALDIINGAAFSAPARVLPYLLKLSYIESFDPDGVIRVGPITTDTIVDIDRAGMQPQKSEYTGQGIVIAIIDTGVDYFHPDLGGCLGVQCRVMGGYDVVDDDNDPIDEHGHGTHVAGIAAGHGLSNGVAQQARILAYRALDENGTGSTSDVIEAISRAVDDGAHIINLSLGDANGLPGSPQNIAVREAVRKGVLVVAAAGNSGPRWGTIGSPGNEELSLTVGALNGSDEPASFSSRGPVQVTYSLKPDVSAPGIGILSAALGGGHIRLNGTSMATPYVAGVAALLMQKLPEADALSIKGLLVKSAHKLPYPYWIVGYGKVNDDIGSYSIVSAIHPTSIGLLAGTTDESGDVISHTFDVTIWNFEDVQKVWRPSHVLPLGVTVSMPDNITVPANTSIRFELVLDVDVDAVEYPTTVPPLNMGHITLTSGNDTLAIPVGVSKPSVLNIEFEMPPSLVIIHDQNGSYEAARVSGRHVSVPLGAGVYDIWALRDADATKWVHENVSVKGSTSLSLSETDAPNTLRFELADPQGKPVGACGYSREYFKHTSSGLGLMYQYERSCPEVSDLVIQTQISDLSDNTEFEVSHVAYGAGTEYEYLRYPFRISGGLKSNQLFRAGGEQFKELGWRYHLPPGVDRASLIRLYDSPGGNVFTPPSWLKTEIQAPWLRYEFVHPNPDKQFVPFQGQFDAVFALDGVQLDPDSDMPLLLTPSIQVTNQDSVHLRIPTIRESSTWSSALDGRTLILGTGPDIWNPGAMAIRNGEIRIPTSNSWFVGWNRELRMGDVVTELLNPAGLVVEKRVLKNGTPKYGSIHPDDWITYQLEDGIHQLAFSRTDTWLGTRMQTTRASIEFDRNSTLPSASCVDRLAILNSAQEPIQSTAWSDGLTIVIESRTCTSIPSVTLTQWSDDSKLPLTATRQFQNGVSRIIYALPGDLQLGYYDLEVRIDDGHQPRFNYLSSPALAVTHGEVLPAPPDAPSLDAPAQRQFIFDSSVSLSWNSVDGADAYRIQLSKKPDFSDTTVDSVGSDTSAVATVSGYGVIWYWRVSARNSEGWGPWSLPRNFTTVIDATTISDDTLPSEWFLDQNYPNPFNPSTTIRFGVASSESVRIDIYTIAGQLVKSVDLGVLQPGIHNINIDLQSLSSGLYLYRMTSPNFSRTRKMTLIK